MKHRREGFTLIELLIVVVIIGILAAIAIPKFANSKGQSFKATMKADLRNLASAQEAYLYDFATYYDGAIPSPTFVYSPSTGVSVTLQNVGPAGWAAVATHANLGAGENCSLFLGNSPAVAPATVEGEIQCQ